jgi:hypothetical protein
VTSQLELEFPVRYVVVQCYGVDQRTGEPRQWRHIVNEHDAPRIAAAVNSRWPDARAEVMR